MSASTGLSIVIPIYNELGAMENLPARLESIRSHIADPVEFILVNDGSTDGSGEALRQLSVPGLRVFDHHQNRGYGATLKTGFREASYPWIAITDADETYPDHRIPEFYDTIRAENADMLVGARVGKNVKIPLVRRPAKWFIGKLANYVAQYKIPDINSGLRVFRKETLMRYVSILPDGFSLTTTITLAMLTCGHYVKYVPIDYAKRTGKSKIRPIRDTVNFVQLVIRTSLLFDPLRIFIPAALMMALCAVSIALYSAYVLERLLDTTVAIFAVGSFQVLATGMIADIINRRVGPMIPVYSITGRLVRDEEEKANGGGTEVGAAQNEHGERQGRFSGNGTGAQGQDEQGISRSHSRHGDRHKREHIGRAQG